MASSSLFVFIPYSVSSGASRGTFLCFSASGRRSGRAPRAFRGRVTWPTQPIWAGSPDGKAFGGTPGPVSVATSCETGERRPISASGRRSGRAPRAFRDRVTWPTQPIWAGSPDGKAFGGTPGQVGVATSCETGERRPISASGRRTGRAPRVFRGRVTWPTRPIWSGSPDEDASGGTPGPVSVATSCGMRARRPISASGRRSGRAPRAFRGRVTWPTQPIWAGSPDGKAFGGTPGQVGVATSCGMRARRPISASGRRSGMTGAVASRFYASGRREAVFEISASGRRTNVALSGFGGGCAWPTRPNWAGLPDWKASGGTPGQVIVATSCGMAER